MKTLKTQKTLAYLVYQNLDIKPDQYSSASEMKTLLNDVQPAIEEEVKDFVSVIKEFNSVRNTLEGDELTKKINEVNRKISDLDSSLGKEEISVQLENEAANAFVNFFNKNGMKWFNSGSNYIEFEKSINEMNKESGK